MLVVPPLYVAIVAAGLCLGLQMLLGNRIRWCGYCAGFHCGWLTWTLWAAVEQPALGGFLSFAVSVGFWALFCAWVCRISDAVLTRLESP